MAIMQINVERFSLISTKPFEEVVAAIEERIGHPDMIKFTQDVAATRTDEELQKIVNRAVGPSGLMEMARFDLGEVLRKELGDNARPMLRLIAGNPLIMKQMAKLVPDAGSYAPVTILIDERDDGVHLSYDRMASLLAPYNNAEALTVAQSLDFKVESLLQAAAT